MKIYSFMGKRILFNYASFCIFLSVAVFVAVFFFLDISVNAENVFFDIGKNSPECNDSSKVYYVCGKTKGNHIKISGGTKHKPIIVSLGNGLDIDLRD